MTVTTYARRLLAPVLLVGVVSTSAAIGVQAQQPAPRTTRPATPRQPAIAPAAPRSADDELFEQAATLGEAEAAAWIEAADSVLAKAPTDRQATTRKLAAHLAMGRVPEALVTYESWSKAAAREDHPLLRRLAGAVLRQLETAPSSDLRAQALEARARGGDVQARERLMEHAKESAATPDAWQARVALARLGDRASVGVLATRARQGMGSMRLGALDALRGLPVTPEVVTALRDALALDDPMLQGTAATLAGELGATALIPQLKTVVATGRLDAPLRAACALVALGDTTMRARVDEALTGSLPDVTLLAAQALRTASIDTWQPAVRPVLKDANPILRLQAAAMLLSTLADEAMPIVSGALADPNPVMREEAMRFVADRPDTALILLKRGLIDASPGVRLRAAAALDARARSAGSAP